MLRFSRNEVQGYDEDNFEHFKLHTWDRQCFRGFETEAFATREWRDIIAVDNKDLSYHGSADTRKTPHVADVSKMFLTLAGGPLVEEDGNVDLWSYSYYVERRYVANFLCSAGG